LHSTARRAALSALGISLLGAPTAHAADPIGVWLTEDREATIRIARCGRADAICGSIATLRESRDPATGRPKTDEHNRDVRLRQRPLVGVQVVVQMQPNDRAGVWSGHVYNPDDGGFYPATLTLLSARALRLEGCMLKGALCRGQTWVRLR
jgi:uncharacterized protein (DUF2147 family)